MLAAAKRPSAMSMGSHVSHSFLGRFSVPVLSRTSRCTWGSATGSSRGERARVSGDGGGHLGEKEGGGGEGG